MQVQLVRGLDRRSVNQTGRAVAWVSELFSRWLGTLTGQL